jgi:hypothetical protein
MDDNSSSALLLHKVDDLRHALEELARPNQSQGSGFMWGLLTAAVACAFLWWRLNFTLSRWTQISRQRQALRQLNNIEPSELRSLLGEVELPSWIQYPDYQRVRWLCTVRESCALMTGIQG